MIDLTKAIAASAMNKLAAFAIEVQDAVRAKKPFATKFIDEVRWTNKQDIANAWERYAATDKAVEGNAVLGLYTFLGNRDKIALLEWVMDNVNNESKLDLVARD